MILKPHQTSPKQHGDAKNTSKSGKTDTRTGPEHVPNTFRTHSGASKRQKKHKNEKKHQNRTCPEHVPNMFGLNAVKFGKFLQTFENTTFKERRLEHNCLHPSMKTKKVIQMSEASDLQKKKRSNMARFLEIWWAQSPKQLFGLRLPRFHGFQQKNQKIAKPPSRHPLGATF